MKLIIDIPEGVYNLIVKQDWDGFIANAVKHGTPIQTVTNAEEAEAYPIKGEKIMQKFICDICGTEFEGYRGCDENGYTQIAHVEVMDSRYFQGEWDICNNCITDIRNFIDEHWGAIVIKHLKGEEE